MNIKSFSIFIVFLLGLYFAINVKKTEGFGSLNRPRCHDVLIQKGTNFYLYNSKLANVPGVNPISFDKLSDYTEFIDWQRSQGIDCPVLYLQESYNVQGETVYRARDSPSNLQGIIQDQPTSKLFDAGRDDTPYNKNSYPSFDSQDQYIGLDTPLDKMYRETGTSVSPNPMDTNWGGQEFTKSLVERGYYDDRIVKKPVENDVK